MATARRTGTSRPHAKPAVKKQAKGAAARAGGKSPTRPKPGGTNRSGVAKKPAAGKAPRVIGKPAVSGKGIGKPAISGRVIGKPAVSGRVIGKPAISGRVIGKPAVSGRVIGKPAVSGRVIGKPAVSGKVIGKPAVSGRVIGKPAVSGRVIGKPAVSGRVIGKPAVSGRVIGKPAVSGKVIGKPAVSGKKGGKLSVRVVTHSPKVEVRPIGTLPPDAVARAIKAQGPVVRRERPQTRPVRDLKIDQGAQGVTEKDFKEFELRLITERKKIMKDMGYLETTVLKINQRDSAGDLSGYSYHMADVGTDAMEREKAFLFASAEGRLLVDFNDALRKVYNGEYGRCEICEQPISRARLEAMPSARLCLACKEKQEREHRGIS